MKTMLVVLTIAMALAVAGADLAGLQVARRQAEIQQALVRKNLDAAEKKLAADTKAHDKKVEAESKTYVITRSPLRTRKGTGDPNAQTAINNLQATVMTGTITVDKLKAECTQLDQRIAAIDQQLATLQPLAPTQTPAGASQPPQPAGVIEVSPKSARGYTVGPLAAGSVLRLQYISGKWKAWGGFPTASPDDPQDRGGDDKGGERNRLVIVNILPDGQEKVLAIVPPGTAEKPFEFTAAEHLSSVALRINDGDGTFASNPDGHVKYRLTVLAAGGAPK